MLSFLLADNGVFFDTVVILDLSNPSLSLLTAPTPMCVCVCVCVCVYTCLHVNVQLHVHISVPSIKARAENVRSHSLGSICLVV